MSGNAHTADFVSITALGPGAERFRGFVQNTDVFRHYTDLADIDFRNPEAELIAENRHPGREAGDVEQVQEYLAASVA
jgi:hypothetical protein